MQNDQLRRAIKIVGSQQKLAEKLGISVKTLNHWFNREIRVPLQFALAIEIFTEGQVYASDLAPYAKSQVIDYNKYLSRKKYQGKSQCATTEQYKPGFG